MAPGIALALADSATILGPPLPPLLCQSLLNLGFFPRTSFWPWLKMSSFALLQPHSYMVVKSPPLSICHCPQVHSPLLPYVPPPRLYCSTDCSTRCPLLAHSRPAQSLAAVTRCLPAAPILSRPQSRPAQSGFHVPALL